MSDGPEISAASFGDAFRAFLEQSVNQQPSEEPPFVARLAEHLGVDPRGLPIITERMSAIEHPNVQAALDAWNAAPGRTSELVGMSSEHKRFTGIGMSDLVTPIRSGLMGDTAPRPGPVDYVNVAVARGKSRACVQHGLYLLRDGEEPLAAILHGPGEHGPPQVKLEVMARKPERAAAFLAEIRENMRVHNIYRGQLLTLGSPHGPFGEGGPMVEFLAVPEMEREA